LALIRTYRENGKIGARNEVVRRTLYITKIVAEKFSGRDRIEDILQAGVEGLLNALEHFDTEREVQFNTYTTHMVRGNIKHHLRDHGRTIKLPSWVQELDSRIRKASKELEYELLREPTVEEIAESIHKSPRQVEYARKKHDITANVISLDNMFENDEDDMNTGTYEKLASTGIPVDDLVTTRVILAEAMRKLKLMERRATECFFMKDMNQTEIAKHMGISVNYAGYLIRGGIVEMKRYFERSSQTPEYIPRQHVFDMSGYPPQARHLHKKVAAIDERLGAFVSDLFGTTPTGREILCAERLERYLGCIPNDGIDLFCEVYGGISGDGEAKTEFIRSMHKVRGPDELLDTADSFRGKVPVKPDESSSEVLPI
jgi:DNA-directed RNA polymerase specialized sigma subunit